MYLGRSSQFREHKIENSRLKLHEEVHLEELELGPNPCSDLGPNARAPLWDVEMC